ncbi:hypothetical protein FHX84_005460, partial [Clostridium beijerinckii]|nr:hypothetical protein [Clostridium beijerinckii]
RILKIIRGVMFVRKINSFLSNVTTRLYKEV